MMKKNTYKSRTKTIISNKMQILDDFGICDKDDKSMIEKLKKAIDDNPDRDPTAVLDCYCRPMIQSKVNSWH